MKFGYGSTCRINKRLYGYLVRSISVLNPSSEPSEKKIEFDPVDDHAFRSDSSEKQLLPRFVF